MQKLLYPVLFHKKAGQEVDAERDLVDGAPSVWMTSATLTQAIQKMVGDTAPDNLVHAKRHYAKRSDDQDPDSAPPTARTMVLPRMKVVKAAGLHKTVPRLQQVFVDTANVDKLSLLTDVLSSSSSNKAMVFCNTASACRAVEYALREARLEGCISYHGDLPSTIRNDNLRQFRDDSDTNILVCTDLAARGIDVPAVDHVVMFDFPLNALDYLHRSGRTARGVANSGRQAKVTALVTKRDKVLANAIERAVQRGEPLDGLSSRKTDYLPGGRLDGFHNHSKNRNSSSSSSQNKAYKATTSPRNKKTRPKDTTARKKRR